MSFSSQIKDEIIKNKSDAPCCKFAYNYGMLLFSRSFTINDISLLTDNERVAEEFSTVTGENTGAYTEIFVSEAKKYTVSYSERKDREKILSRFSLNGNERQQRINRGNLLNESFSDEDGEANCCDASFLKGAFLSCGTASDPNKSYHLEFVVQHKTLSMDLLKLLNDYGFKAKHMTRRFVNVIYIKDSESIEDLLTFMGAQNCSMEIMNIKILKDIRNLTNRRNNFESANISRTAYASFDQNEAIKKIKEKGIYVTLPEDLKQIANIRSENPDASLREIGEMCSPPLSRSAVNHRLKKLIAIADSIN